jgi:hypothetical protein
MILSPVEPSIPQKDGFDSTCSLEIGSEMVTNLRDVSSDNDTTGKYSELQNNILFSSRSHHNCYFDYADTNGNYVCSGGLVKFNTTLKESELVFKVPKRNIGSLKVIFTHLLQCIATRGLDLHSVVCTLSVGDDQFMENVVHVLHDLHFFDGGVETQLATAKDNATRKYKYIIVANEDTTPERSVEQHCNVCRRVISGRTTQKPSEGKCILPTINWCTAYPVL